MSFITNDFVIDFEVSRNSYTTERNGKGIFINFKEENNVVFGCIFTLKKTMKTKKLCQCRKCRHFLDIERKNGSSINATNLGSVYIADGNFDRWVNENHHPHCVLEPSGISTARSYKNRASIYKSEYGCTSKEAFTIHHQFLNKKEKLSAKEIGSGFGIFSKTKNTLNKSGNRKSAQRPKLTDKHNKVIKELTKIAPTFRNEIEDYFLIFQNDDLIVLGSKFMATKFFVADKLMADGTFKVAPIGYEQIYILWWIEEKYIVGDVDDIQRCKAFPAFYILMKNRQQSDYETALEAIETYR